MSRSIVVLVLRILRVEFHLQIIDLVLEVEVLLLVQIFSHVDVLLELLLKLGHLNLEG